ncbi:MAG: hypothetical protein FWF02_12540 [Micrococcales bacterium]|nr:hypothetical protein [Micrococcales bacterium]MCL2668505.1 hypothetical protein [Micrococcales bacterium]
MDRPVPGGFVWELGLDPGFIVGAPMCFEEQTLHPSDLVATVKDRYGWKRDTGPRLDPITVSEILRDLHTLHG